MYNLKTYVTSRLKELNFKVNQAGNSIVPTCKEQREAFRKIDKDEYYHGLVSEMLVLANALGIALPPALGTPDSGPMEGTFFFTRDGKLKMARSTKTSHDVLDAQNGRLLTVVEDGWYRFKGVFDGVVQEFWGITSSKIGTSTIKRCLLKEDALTTAKIALSSIDARYYLYSFLELLAIHSINEDVWVGPEDLISAQAKPPAPSLSRASYEAGYQAGYQEAYQAVHQALAKALVPPSQVKPPITK